MLNCQCKLCKNSNFTIELENIANITEIKCPNCLNKVDIDIEKLKNLVNIMISSRQNYINAEEEIKEIIDNYYSSKQGFEKWNIIIE